MVALPGVILNSGLVANAPELVKILTMVASVLAALGYTTNRTSLKKAHLAALAAAAPANSNAALPIVPTATPPGALPGFARLTLIMFLSILSLGGMVTALSCAAVQKMSGAFASCAKTDFNQAIDLRQGSPRSPASPPPTSCSLSTRS